MSIQISKFKLLSPLFYVPEQSLRPFEDGEAEAEKIFCFELEEAQYRNIEPDREKFFGNLIFAGRAVKKFSCGELPGTVQIGGKELSVGQLRLPEGDYLFSQERRFLVREEAAVMALEIQAEGLWQRLKPGRKLYLRRLFEDGSPVTQLFRPWEE